MDWQGIPYKFISEDTANTVNLALQSIPKIIVDTPTDYTSPFITGVVSLVAGIIPAGIAIWTFKRNAANTKIERLRQETFLTNERAEQQRFLKEERAAQIASTEKDRETQLAISKKNFDMQVLSVNRQAWINSLRDLIADYIALAPTLLDARFNYLNSKEHYTATRDRGSNEPKLYSNEVFKKSLDEASLKLQSSIATIENVKSKERFLTSKIKMMLNPREKWYAEFEREFNDIAINYNSFEELDMDDYKKKINKSRLCMESILKTAQELMKSEWERVKKGI